MLTVNDKLSPKEIVGKKYRSPNFYIGFVSCIVLTVIWIVSLITLPPMDRESTLLVIFMSLVGYLFGFLIFFLVCLFNRKILCIVTKEKFYFFKSSVIKYKSKTKKSKDAGCCSGTVEYADIVKTDYIYRNWFGGRYQRKIPGRLVIFGENFEITIFAPHLVQKKLEACIAVLPTYAIDDIEYAEAPVYPEGLWGDIVQAFDNCVFESLWEEDIVLDVCKKRISDNSISIVLEQRNWYVCFDIDNEEICFRNSEAEEGYIKSLAEFNNLEAVLAYMKNYAIPPK